jgi:4-amino-4-deoxy-L-arabinose transferase-like glycosyltransferase
MIAVVAIAAVGRVLLLASGSVSFHSDEAIVGLMARHILAGDPPTFFFGQAYMGSLDAWLVALGFWLFGESVLSIRLVQAALYLGVVASAYAAGAALLRRADAAFIVGLCFAVGTPLLTLYTAATLGGYNETLLLGHSMIALAAGRVRLPAWRWALIGLLTGVGWWTNALIVVYAVPVAAMLAWRAWAGRSDALVRREFALGTAIALGGFMLGSAPWWLYALQNDLAPIRFFLPEVLGSRETVGAVIPSIPWNQRLIGLLLLGLPSAVGLRFPWAGDFFAPAVGVAVVACYAAALLAFARGKPGDALRAQMGIIVAGMFAVLCALFLLTRFSSDPSGRYFVPLTLPLALLLANWVTRLPRAAGLVIVALVIGYHAAGQVVAARAQPGFTTQFVAQTHLPNDDDHALIAWMDARGLRHGYTTYWVSFRIAFLSGERIRMSAALPDKSDLAYTPAFERYPPYREATDASAEIAYITANVPELDAALEAWFAQSGATYSVAQVGTYRVYHDFAPAPPRPPLR